MALTKFANGKNFCPENNTPETGLEFDILSPLHHNARNKRFWRTLWLSC